MTMTEPGADLILRPQIAPMSPDEAKQAMQEYQEMCLALLEPDDGNQGGDLQRIGKKDHPKRSAMQKLAAAYNVSTEIIKDISDYDDEGEIVRAKITVRATHPNGRTADGDGTCTRDEPNFRKGNPKLEHNIHATAVTRAKNRAIGDLIAFGAVSAEEIEVGGTARAHAGVGEPPAWAAPMSDDSLTLVAKNLVRILQAAGVDKPGEASVRIGEEIFKLCEDSFPFALARLAKLLAEACEPLDIEQADIDEAVEGEIARGHDLDAEADAAIDNDDT